MRARTAVLLATALTLWGPALPAQGAGTAGGGNDPSAISIFIGYGSAESEWFDRVYRSDGLNDYGAHFTGGFVIGLRTLIGVASRMRVGGEIGILTINHGVGGDVVTQTPTSTITCVGCSAPPDDAGIHLNGLMNLRLLTIGRWTWRIEGGGGLMIWNLNDAGLAAKRNYAMKFNTGRGHYDSKPGPESFVVGRLVPSVAFGDLTARGNFTLTPYLAMVKTFGTTSTSALNFGVDLGAQWRRMP